MKTRLRNYRAGDDQPLLALQNLAHASYSGNVKRTVEYWRWSVLQRPGVTTEDILILESGTGIAAYGVLGPQGEVLELAIDPRLPGREREALAAKLHAALEERSRKRGDDMIRIEVPRTDEAVCRTLSRAGYRQETGESFNIAIVDLAGLITKLLSHRAQRFPRGWSPTFLFELLPGYYSFSPYQQLLIRIGPPVRVEPNPFVQDSDCTVMTDLSTLADLIFRRTDFESAFDARDVTISPVSCFRDVERLVEFLVLQSPWYTPNADAW